MRNGVRINIRTATRSSSLHLIGSSYYWMRVVCSFRAFVFRTPSSAMILHFFLPQGHAESCRNADMRDVAVPRLSSLRYRLAEDAVTVVTAVTMRV